MANCPQCGSATIAGADYYLCPNCGYRERKKPPPHYHYGGFIGNPSGIYAGLTRTPEGGIARLYVDGPTSDNGGYENL